MLIRANRTKVLVATLRASVGCLCLLTAMSVRAQDASAPQPTDTATPAEEPESALGEIIVTANKRAQNLQKTAMSITAISPLTIESRNITDAGSLQGLAPGVSIQPSFILLTYIRGLGNYSSQPGTDQSVAYNVDGIYISKPYGMPTILYDLERIEMLRGPQGTLQGRNATAGSINFITARPTMDFGAKVSLSYGNYDAVSAEGMVNIPLGEKAALRVSAATSQHSPYFRNGYGDANAQGVRARLLLKPTDRLEILVTGEYTQRNERGATYSPCPPGSTAAQGCAGVKWDPWAGTPGQGTSETLNMNEENILFSKSRALYAEVNYDLDFATLTYIPSYRHFRYRNVQTLSSAFGYAPAVINELHTEELRLSSNAGSPIKWVVGLYYAREAASEQNYFQTALGPFISIDRPDFNPIGHVYFKNDVGRYTYRSQSVFGQVEVPILPGIRLVGGLRYTDDKKFHAGNTGIVLADAVTGLPKLVSVDVGGRQSDKKLNYKAGVEFDVADKVMVYGNVSSGYKAGGVNGIPPGSSFEATFQPEEVTAFQAGFKSRFLDDRVQINAEGFYYDYSGYQTSTFAVTSDGVLIGGTTNSQTAKLYGGELESSFAISPLDRFDLAITLLSAKYTKFEVPSAGLNLSGKTLQNAPTFTLTANYFRTFELKSGATVVAHLEGRRESGQWVDFRLNPGSFQPAFVRLHADITYNAPGGNWTLGAFIRNITNDDALVVANAGLGPYMLGQAYPPRTFGAKATAKF